MGGVILENLSGRKLSALVAGLIICQVTCFLIGGIIAPAPYNAMNMLSVKCIDRGSEKDKWFVHRGKGTDVCESINEFSDPVIDKDGIHAGQIVFTFMFPLPKEGMQLKYSRWFQNLIGVMQLEASFDERNPIVGKPPLTLDLRMAYRDAYEKDKEWKLLASAVEEKTMDCVIDESHKTKGHYYNCSSLPLFELGSVYHSFYLLNIRIPVAHNRNTDIGKIEDIWLTVIHQNGGFTMVWLSIKSVFFPAIIAIMIWYWRRIRMLQRRPALLEKMLFALGLALTLLNLPVEFLTLWLDMPFMLLLSDIRQGIFYAMLLSFWLVFAGEHMMDDAEHNQLNYYWKHLSAVVFGCLCLFVFDMCERGVQLSNPFFSIWATELGTNLALSFIILAGISACVYFLFLCYMIFKVMRNIKFKRLTISRMSSVRKKFYEGVIYRFKFLMLATLLCAALTVISFILGQVAEGSWKWEEDIHPQMEYTSAFVCGVYGMWNIYVFALIFLYAPSHKQWNDESDGDNQNTRSTGEEIECSHLLSESREPSVLSALVKKATVASD